MMDVVKVAEGYTSLTLWFGVFWGVGLISVEQVLCFSQHFFYVTLADRMNKNRYFPGSQVFLLFGHSGAASAFSCSLKHKYIIQRNFFAVSCFSDMLLLISFWDFLFDQEES